MSDLDCGTSKPDIVPRLSSSTIGSCPHMMTITLATPSLNPEAGGPASLVTALGKQLQTHQVRARFTAWTGRSEVPTKSHSFMPFYESDLVHSFGLWTMLNHWVCLSSRLARRPLVISPIGMLEPWSMAQHATRKHFAMIAYQRRDLAIADVLHVTSAQEAGNVRALGFGPPVALIPHAVDIPALEDPLQRPRPSSRRRLLFLSRLHEKKGLLDLIEAWAALRPTDWKVIVAGPDEGNYRAVLEAAVEKQCLGDSFQFLGAVYGEKKEQLMRSCDLFVLPTYSENFGLVIPEALAHGLPVITTTGTPWSELVETRSGFWIEPGVDSLVECLRGVLTLSSEELSAMGARGRLLVEERYGWDAIVAKHIALYQWLIGSGLKPSFVD